MVRDQEAGGSNPLAPTNPFNTQFLSSSFFVFARQDKPQPQAGGPALLGGGEIASAEVGAQGRQAFGGYDLDLQDAVAAVAGLVLRDEAEDVAVAQFDADLGGDI